MTKTKVQWKPLLNSGLNQALEKGNQRAAQLFESLANSAALRAQLDAARTNTTSKRRPQATAARSK